MVYEESRIYKTVISIQTFDFKINTKYYNHCSQKLAEIPTRNSSNYIFLKCKTLCNNLFEKFEGEKCDLGLR